MGPHGIWIAVMPPWQLSAPRGKAVVELSSGAAMYATVL